MKTHWKKLVNPDYLGAYSLGDEKEMNVTIKNVVREQVTGTGGKKEECTVAHMTTGKPMILNNTNCKTIARIYGTSFIEDWVDKPITLYIAKIKAFGEDNIECLRIREAKPELPELKPTDLENWDKVLQALGNGYKIDQIKTKWKISKSNQERLISEAI